MPQSQDKTLTKISTLLYRYGFELNGVTIPQLIQNWSAKYSVHWIRLGIIEALYQGRYKVISIEQILRSWRRRRQATYHFSGDFERLITETLIIDDMTDKLTETETFPQGKHPSKNLEKKGKITQLNGQNLVHHLNVDRSIHQFRPNFDSSEFYNKLRAIAHQELTQNFD